jgi:hypothetical protein
MLMAEKMVELPEYPELGTALITELGDGTLSRTNN